MDDDTRHKLIWGWLRFFLGMAQMFLTTAALIVLVFSGVHLVTWILVGAATTATIISRILYRGRPDPRLEGKKHE